jgi:hypothetical protein
MIAVGRVALLATSGAADATVNASTVTIAVELPAATITTTAGITASTVTIAVELPVPTISGATSGPQPLWRIGGYPLPPRVSRSTGERMLANR